MRQPATVREPLGPLHRGGAAAQEAPRVPLNALDEVHALSETPSEPWSIHLEARVDGRLDSERLGAAVRAALQNHPLARARLVEDHERLYWLVDPRPMCEAVLACRAHTPVQLDLIRSKFLSALVPLTASPPLRARLVHAEQADHLILNVNHAVCDGLSALRLMQSIARAYGGERDPVFLGDALKEWRLGEMATPAAVPVHATLAGIERLIESLTPASRIASDGGMPGPGYGCHLRTLDLGPIIQSRFRRAAGASVNDFLLAALHRAVGRWNHMHGVHSDRLSIIVPINVRGHHQHPALVGNFTMSDIVSTRAAERMNAAVTLKAVRQQTKRFKETGAPFAALVPRCAGWPSWLDRRIPGLFRGAHKDGPGECAVFSNLGRGDLAVASFGADLPVTGLWFSPPVTSPVGVGIGVVSQGNALHAALRYRRSRFDDSGAIRLFNLIIAQITESC